MIQKQKFILIVLAFLMVGMGSYYFFVHDSGGSNQVQLNSGPIERRQRTKSEEKSISRRKSDKPSSPAKPITVERKEREETVIPTEVKRRDKTRPEKNIKQKKPTTVG